MNISTTINENTSIKGLIKEIATYIIDNHPDMILTEGKDAVEKFCIERSNGAIKIWSDKLQEGLNEDVAWEFAHEYAYSGLIFSKFNTIVNAIESVSPTYLLKIKDETEMVAFVTKIISKCDDFFERYVILNNTVLTAEMEDELKKQVLNELIHLN